MPIYVIYSSWFPPRIGCGRRDRVFVPQPCSYDMMNLKSRTEIFIDRHGIVTKIHPSFTKSATESSRTLSKFLRLQVYVWHSMGRFKGLRCVCVSAFARASVCVWVCLIDISPREISI